MGLTGKCHKFLVLASAQIHRAVRAVQEGRPIGKAGRPRHLLDDELERFFSLMRDHQGEKRLDYDAMQEEVTKKI